MKRLFLLLLVPMLAACGGTPTNTTPPDSNTQVTDGFKITYTPANNFYVAKGSTGTLQISADITKPEDITKLKVQISVGTTYLNVSPTNFVLRDNTTQDVQISVSTTAQDNQKPFIKVSIIGVNAKDESVTEQVTKDFIWTLQAN
jgi:hypothetical protein